VSAPRAGATPGGDPGDVPRDRIVLITGGARGIGRAVALAFARRERPRHIVIAYTMNHDAARATVRDLGELGVAASAIPTDVGNADLQRELFDEVRSRCGGLDVFVCNAARAAFRPVAELNLRNFQRTLELNLHAYLQGAQLAAEMMRPRGGGYIVAMSSLGAGRALPGYAALGAAKAGIESLTRYLAAELAPAGIVVNAVSAGFIDTESMRLNPDYERLKEYVRARTPAGCVGQPEHLAGLVVFLSSPEARWVRGQTVVADGGLSLLL
jgi:enoyl-[acyl-carrier protein] reductase III